MSNCNELRNDIGVARKRESVHACIRSIRAIRAPLE